MKAKAYCKDSRGEIRIWEMGEGQFSEEDITSTLSYLNSSEGRLDLYKSLDIKNRSILKKPILMCIST